MVPDELVPCSMRCGISGDGLGDTSTAGAAGGGAVQHASGRAGQASARGLPGSSTTRCCRVFTVCCLRFQTASYLLPERPAEAKSATGWRDCSCREGDHRRPRCGAGPAGVDARTQRSRDGDPHPRRRLATSASDRRRRSTFRVVVEGETRDLHPIVRDEIYKIAVEALRNAFRHAQAGRVEVEIRYDDEQFRLRVRDDGKGIDPAVLADHGLDGHYGLRGMPERAGLIGGKLAVWSEVGAGTEVELRLPASIVYATSARRSWLSRLFVSKASGTRRRKTANER